jgi:hypothetical protein
MDDEARQPESDAPPGHVRPDAAEISQADPKGCPPATSWGRDRHLRQERGPVANGVGQPAAGDGPNPVSQRLRAAGGQAGTLCLRPLRTGESHNGSPPQAWGDLMVVV